MNDITLQTKKSIQKIIKESTRDFLEVIEALAGRTVIEKTRRLNANNLRIHREVENLTAELKVHVFE